MSKVVMKFGGTSVSTPGNRKAAIEHVKREIGDGNTPVIVVSAMGRKGAPYATDTLLSLIDGCGDPVIRDLIASCGETISACVFAKELMDNGIPAKPFTGESAFIRTDSNFGKGEIENIDPEMLERAISDGMVPVITGFQGRSTDGSTVTLGRGGSDTSAVVIGGYIKADAVDIYTDVEGIADADPRVVPDAKYLNEISAEDALKLAQWGSGVIHPRAVSKGIDFAIPTLRVRSTFSEKQGTAIKTSITGKGFSGVTLLKNIKESADGEYEVSGKRYTKTDDGELAIITAIVHDMTDEQTDRLKSEFPEVFISGPEIRWVSSMSDAIETTQKLYKILK